jgi:hypothetical protein
MILTAKQIIDQGFEGKWLQLSEDEQNAVIESIAGENLRRNAHFNKMDGSTNGDNLRHYQDRGYIVVHGGFGKEAERHPLDLPQVSSS